MRLLCALLLALLAPAVRAADPQPLDPRGLPGPLVLTGPAPGADAARALFDLGGKDKAKIVVLAFAAKGDAGAPGWTDLKPAAVDVFRAGTAADAGAAPLLKALEGATAVWLAGESAELFRTAVVGKPIEKALKGRHAAGVPIGGPLAAELGLISGYQFGTATTASAVEKQPGSVGVGFGKSGAIVVRGRVARVIGDDSITVRVGKGAGKPAANEEYKAGSLIDLCQLQRAALNRAAKDSFPPAKPAEPEVKKGALVIVGGGGAGPEIWKRFIELAGGPDAPIVVVTTAMEDPLAPESVEEKILKKFGAKNVTALHTRDRKEADTPKFSESLLKAKGVWFSGGRQWRFVDSYEGTLTAKRFHEVLARGGVIGGSSAGASIQSEYMPRGHPLGNTVMAAEGYERGFGYLPGCAVDQHFFARKRTADMTGLMKEYPQYLGIGLDEGTAIVVTGNVAEVIGRSKVAFYDTKKKPDGDKDYEEVFPNGKYDLKARRKVKE